MGHLTLFRISSFGFRVFVPADQRSVRIAPEGKAIRREPDRSALISVERRALLARGTLGCRRSRWPGLWIGRGLRRGPGFTPDKPERRRTEQDPPRSVFLDSSNALSLLMGCCGQRATPSSTPAPWQLLEMHETSRGARVRDASPGREVYSVLPHKPTRLAAWAASSRVEAAVQVPRKGSTTVSRSPSPWRHQSARTLRRHHPSRLL